MILKDFIKNLDYTPSKIYVLPKNKQAFVEINENNFDEYKNEQVSHTREDITIIRTDIRAELYIYLEYEKESK